MRISSWWLAAFVLAACGDDEPPAGPKAPELTIREISPFADVELTKWGSARITLRNTGTAATGDLAVEVSKSPETDGVVLLASNSECVGQRLEPGRSCAISVQFYAWAPGPAMVMVRVTDASAENHVLEVPLTANVRPRRGVLVTFFGTQERGAVRVIVLGKTTVCNTTCIVPAVAGAQVTLKADTPSRFGAFSGACTSMVPECTFAAQESNEVVVRFDADPRSRTTYLFPGEVVRSVDYDATGNLIIGTSKHVYKRDYIGNGWRVEQPGEARAGAGGTVIVRNAGTTTILDVNGRVSKVFSTIAGGCAAEPNPMARTWATMPDGGLAIQGPDALVVYNADGTVRFTKSPIGPGCRGPLTVGSDGRIYTGIENLSTDPTDLLVFEANGAAAPTLENAAPQYHLALAARNGRLAIASSGHSYVSLRTLGARATDTNVSDPDYVDHGVAIDDDGDVASVLALREDTSAFATGAVVRRYSPDMTQRWSLTKPVLNDPLALETSGVTPVDVAIDDRSGYMAVGGRYYSPTFDGGWIQIFAEP